MYKKILIPLDGSKLAEQILPFARSFAEASQAPVELLKVNDPGRIAAYAPPLQGGEYLDAVAKKFFPPHWRIEKTVELGEPATIIVERTGGDPDCLIAMATHGMSGIRRWLMGSVASKVAQTSLSPVLLIHPTETTESPASFRPGTILLPLDGSGLAEKALAHAAEIAKRMISELHLLRVYSVPSHAYVVADGVTAQGPVPFRDAMELEATTYLNAKADGLRADGIKQLTVTAIEGDAATEIIDLVDRTPMSMVVMSTHGRSGVGRWLLGSIAERVIQHSHAPVLLIRSG